jgi:hypothetical protein
LTQPPIRHPHYIRGRAISGNHGIFIPPSLGIADTRALTINLGGGNCIWTHPEYIIPEEIDFHKTVIAGYPSGDKRMIFLQMEALTGWGKLGVIGC